MIRANRLAGFALVVFFSLETAVLCGTTIVTAQAARSDGVDLGLPTTKESLLEQIKQAATKRLACLEAGRVKFEFRDTVKKSQDQEPTVRFASRGEVYFDGTNIRIEHTVEEANSLRSHRMCLVHERWWASWRDSSDEIGVHDVNTLNDVTRTLSDPRGRGIPAIRSLHSISFVSARLGNFPCLRINEVIRSTGTRIIQYIDQDKGFVLLRRETYYDNTFRSDAAKRDETAPSKVEDLEWRWDKNLTCWLLDKYRITRHRGNETFVDAVKYDYNLGPVPSDSFSIVNLLARGRELRDFRQGDSHLKKYDLPARSLVDPMPVDYRKYLPFDLLRGGE